MCGNKLAISVDAIDMKLSITDPLTHSLTHWLLGVLSIIPLSSSKHVRCSWLVAGNLLTSICIFQTFEIIFANIFRCFCLYFEMYLSRNRNCSKVHWSKQVRCRRLATGRAGRLSLATLPLPPCLSLASPTPPAAPTHSLGFYSPPASAKMFYFHISMFAFLYFCTSQQWWCVYKCHENPSSETKKEIICFGKHIVFIGVMNLNMSFSWFSQTGRLTRTSAIHLSA